MAIEKVNEIDAIGIDKESGRVILSIIDGSDWNDEYNHLRLLQEKINAYLRFIESEEIYEVYPDALNREVDIKILAKYELPVGGKEFLDKAVEVIGEAGFGLSHKVLG